MEYVVLLMHSKEKVQLLREDLILCTEMESSEVWGLIYGSCVTNQE